MPVIHEGVKPYLADRKYINEILPSGDYRVGFTADNDILPPNRTYLQNMTIRVISNYGQENEACVTYTDTLMR